MLYIITSYSTQQVVISRKYNEKSQLYEKKQVYIYH